MRGFLVVLDMMDAEETSIYQQIWDADIIWHFISELIFEFLLGWEERKE